jgi:hypothetical protein
VQLMMQIDIYPGAFNILEEYYGKNVAERLRA